MCVAVRSADGTLCLAFLALTFQYSLSTHKIMERGANQGVLEFRKNYAYWGSPALSGSLLDLASATNPFSTNFLA